MPDVWPPPPTNQPQIGPPLVRFRRQRNGLDALVTAVIATLCITVSLPFVFSYSPAVTRGPVWDEVSVICVIGALFFGVSSLTYGLLSWNSLFGKIALTIDLGMIGIVSIIGYLGP